LQVQLGLVHGQNVVGQFAQLRQFAVGDVILIALREAVDEYRPVPPTEQNDYTKPAGFSTATTRDSLFEDRAAERNADSDIQLRRRLAYLGVVDRLGTRETLKPSILEYAQDASIRR
jgi:hypothetical protein